MAQRNSRAITRSPAATVLEIAACAALTAVGAQWAFRLPFTPVPVTWQVASVLIAGLTLGARRGFASQALYLAVGMAGAPVFAFAHGGAAYLMNPFGTGGYLLSYPFAAWVVGYLAERAAGDPKKQIIACAAGLGVIYFVGATWLGMMLRLAPARALMLGAGWFLIWDAAKAIIVVCLVRGAYSIRRDRLSR